MADAEQDAQEEATHPPSVSRCSCGSQRFVLEAYLEIDSGVVNREPVEMEALTCPECGREYEPILAEDGRILRGEFRGYFEEADD